MLEHFFNLVIHEMSIYVLLNGLSNKAKNLNYVKILNLQLQVKVCELFETTDKHSLLNPQTIDFLFVLNTVCKPFTAKSKKVCESRSISQAIMNTANF